MKAMSKTILVRAYGGPEALCLEDVPTGAPGPGQVRLRQTAIGVNFHDVYVRSGAYMTLALPGIPGLEAAGVVEELGDGVADLRIGNRVAYVQPFLGAYGAYAESRLIEADRLLRLPDAVDDRIAAATLLKALTVCMLAVRLHPLKPGDRILVQAAAGGVGRLLCQWARHLGAQVIGTVGSEAKAEIARKNGCDHAILYRQEDVAARVRDLTGGRGVDVVYDSVGQDTFDGSISALTERGHLIVFGQSSGPIAPIAIGRLAEKSLSLSRPMLFHYIATRAQRDAMAAQVFAALAAGTITGTVAAEFPLAEAAAAHRRLESRDISGSIVLIP
jgi:NADPH2:quinone reductase